MVQIVTRRPHGVAGHFRQRVIGDLPATPGWRSFSKSSLARILVQSVLEWQSNWPIAAKLAPDSSRSGARLWLKRWAPWCAPSLTTRSSACFAITVMAQPEPNPRAPQASAEIADGTLKLAAHAGYKRRLLFRRRGVAALSLAADPCRGRRSCMTASISSRLRAAPSLARNPSLARDHQNRIVPTSQCRRPIAGTENLLADRRPRNRPRLPK